jgi:hypothetical protein
MGDGLIEIAGCEGGQGEVPHGAGDQLGGRRVGPFAPVVCRRRSQLDDLHDAGVPGQAEHPGLAVERGDLGGPARSFHGDLHPGFPTDLDVHKGEHRLKMTEKP